MADNYYRHVITEKGLAFLAKQQTGETPNITRVIAGVGFVDESLLEQQTEVLVPVGQMQVGPRKVIDGKVVKLPVRLVNTDLQEDETALIRQIGVYSEDPDEGEILYQLLQYSVPQPLPSVAASRGAPAALSVDIDVVFSNSEAAKINSTPSWGVTLEDLDVANIKQSIMAGEDGKPVNLEYLLRSYNEKTDKIESIAKGATRAYIFDTVAELDEWLTEPSNRAELNPGYNLYIRDIAVPDYWWDGVEKQPLETGKVILENAALYALSFSSGWGASSASYTSKDQGGRILLVIYSDKSSAVTNNEVIATIKDDHRPKQYTYGIAGAYTDAGELLGFVSLYVTSDGKIRIQIPSGLATTTMRSIRGSMAMQ